MNIWQRKEVIAGLERLEKTYQSFSYELTGSGRPIIKVGRQRFNTPAEALEFIKSVNLTEIDAFDASAPRYKLPGVGGQQYYRLNELATAIQDEGITFERMGFQNKGAEAIEKVKELYGDKGLVYSRKETTTALIFYDKAGNQLSRQQTLELLRRKGFYFDDSAKTLKRLSALTNNYLLGATGININAAFFDPLQTQRGAQMMAEYGYDFVNTSKGISYRIKSGRAVGEGIDEFFDFMPDDAIEQMRALRDPTRRQSTIAQIGEGNLREAYKKLTGRRLDLNSADQIIEANRFLIAQDAVKISKDGAVYGSARMAQKTENFMREEIKRIEASLQEALNLDPAFERTAEYRRVKNHIRKMQQNLSDLRSAQIHGDIFNVRIMNYNISEADRALGGQGILDDQMKRFAQEVMGFSSEEVNSAKFLGQIKGNISFIAENKKGLQELPEWKKFVTEYLLQYKGKVTLGADGNLYGIDGKLIDVTDIDVLAPFQSVTREFGTVSKKGVAEGLGSISLEKLGQGTDIFIDPQMLFADPEMFNPKAIAQYNMDIARSMTNEIRTDKILKDYQEYLLDKSLGRKTKPTGLLASLIDMAESPISSEGKRAAQKMLDMLDLGIGPTQNPLLAQQFLSEYNQWLGGKEGVPRFKMPLAMQAEVSNTLTASSDVRRGFISYRKGQGFILNDLDYYKYYQAFGGFDLDDMLRTHLVWDRGSDSLHAVTKRSPSALGEIAVLQVDEGDELLDEILRGASKINNSAKEYLETSKLLEAKIKVKALLQEAANPGITTSGNVLSDNLTAMIDAGITEEDFKILGATDEFAMEMTEAIRQGRPLVGLELDFLSGMGIDESLEELATQHALLRTGKGDVTVGGKTLKGRKGALEELMIKYGRAYDSTVGGENLGLTKEIVDRLTARSLSISKDALGGLAEYTDLEKVAAGQGVNMSGLGANTIEEILDESLEAAKRQGILGLGSNLRMSVDSMIAEAQLSGKLDSINAKLDAKGIRRIQVLAQEEMIDAITQQGGKFADVITQLTNDNVNTLADMLYAAEGDLTIDKVMLRNEFGKGKFNQGWQQKVNERLFELSKGTGTIKTLDDYLIEGEYSRIYRQLKTANDMLMQEKARASDSLGVVKSIENNFFTLSAEKEAEEIYNVAKTTYKAFDLIEDQGGMDEFLEMIDYLGDPGFDAPGAIEQLKVTRARTEFVRELFDRGYMREVGQTFEITDEGRNIIGALMQKRGTVAMPVGEGEVPKSLFTSSDALSDMFHSTMEWFENLNRGQSASVSGVVGEDLAKFIRNEVKGSERSQRVSNAIATEIERQAPGSGGYIRARAARSVTDDVLEAIGSSSPGITKMNIENLKPLMNNKLFKGGVFATAGLVAFSALYQKFKDRTPEDVQGPPLLPGGSFYERDPNRYSQEILADSRQSAQNGVTYRVRAIGNFNPEEFSNSIEGLTGANVNSTTYQSRGFNRKKTSIEEAINSSFR